MVKIGSFTHETLPSVSCYVKLRNIKKNRVNEE